MAGILRWLLIFFGLVYYIIPMPQWIRLNQIGSITALELLVALILPTMVLLLCLFAAHSIKAIRFFGGRKTKLALVTIGILLIFTASTQLYESILMERSFVDGQRQALVPAIGTGATLQPIDYTIHLQSFFVSVIFALFGFLAAHNLKPTNVSSEALD